MDNKAQISAEMLVVLAAVIAVAVLVISSLRSTSTTADKKVDRVSSNAMKEVGRIK